MEARTGLVKPDHENRAENFARWIQSEAEKSKASAKIVTAPSEQSELPESNTAVGVRLTHDSEKDLNELGDKIMNEVISFGGELFGSYPAQPNRAKHAWRDEAVEKVGKAQVKQLTEYRAFESHLDFIFR